MLSKEQIIQLIETIPEHQMAKDVFVPVLRKMGLRGVKFTGGPDEQGIDIEYYELTQPEHNKSFVGIQFKKGSLLYSSGGGKNSVKEVRNQAEEAFEKEIHDIDGHSTLFISRFIVAVTGAINEKARTFIGRARQKGQDRRIDYWTGDRLAEYIQTHWMDEFKEYFKIEDEEKLVDTVEEGLVDEEYILENYEPLVKKCIKVKATVSGLEWDILRTVLELQVFRDQDVKIADLLFELGKTEDYLEYELRNLIFKLEYLEADDNFLSLKGHAGDLAALAHAIIEELIDAEEDPDQAIEIFDDLIN